MKRQESEFRKCVRVGYEAGMSPADIARLTGSTVGSVKVTAHRIGVSDTPLIATFKRNRRKIGVTK